MKTHALTDHHTAHRHQPVPARLRPRRSTRVARFVMDRFLLVPLGAAIALIWANSASESYFRFAQALAFPINEVAMALFLALITQEAIEATMPGGDLHTWRRWTMPVVAAAGGIVGAALVYLGYIYYHQVEVLWQAWPIAISIDIAAAYYLLKLVQRRGSALPFMLVLAIATDAFGLAVIAGWSTPTPGHVAGGVTVLAAIGSAAYLRRSGVRQFWPYLVVAGTCSWIGFYLAGVHPALALVPIVPFMPHEPRHVDMFADRPDDTAVHHVEHTWNEAVQVIVFFFALVNAGVMIGGQDVGTWAVLAGALVGRPLGILVAVGIALALGLHLPRHLGWRQLIVIAFATSSGFTIALFFASSLLPIGGVLQQIKFGALGTVLGAPLALLAAWLLHVGRFTARLHHTEDTHGLSTGRR